MRPSRVVRSLGWFGTSLRSSLSLLPAASLLHPFLTVDISHLTLLSFSVLFVFLFGKFRPVWLPGKLVLLEFQQENVFVVIDGSCVFLTMIFWQFQSLLLVLLVRIIFLYFELLER